MPTREFVPFEECDHTADLALTARGRDLRELVLNACRGVIWLIGDVEGMVPEEWAEIEISAADPERRVVGVVKQLLFEWEMRGGLPVTVVIDAGEGEEGSITGRIGFAHPDDLDDRIKSVPKAATYHAVAIRRAGDLLEITLVLDV